MAEQMQRNGAPGMERKKLIDWKWSFLGKGVRKCSACVKVPALRRRIKEKKTTTLIEFRAKLPKSEFPSLVNNGPTSRTWFREDRVRQRRVNWLKKSFFYRFLRKEHILSLSIWYKSYSGSQNLYLRLDNIVNPLRGDMWTRIQLYLTSCLFGQKKNQLHIVTCYRFALWQNSLSADFAPMPNKSPPQEPNSLLAVIRQRF